MKFAILDKEGLYIERRVEINTLDELKAFANGRTGRIEIGFNEIDYAGEMIETPVIASIEFLRSRNKC